MQVIIRATAQRQLDKAIEQGEQMFGLAVATKFYNRFMEYVKRLSTNSEVGFPEPLLTERSRKYRSIMVNEHFKIVYYCDENKNIIYIIALWDTRREPQSLTRRIKGK